jgi:hypothetical protein
MSSVRIVVSSKASPSSSATAMISRIGGLAGEVGRPGDQDVIVAGVPVDAPERLEHPSAEPARGPR